MTKAAAIKEGHGHAGAHRHAHRKRHGHKLALGFLLLLAAGFAGVAVTPRHTLPERIRDNPYVIDVYAGRDAALDAGAALVAGHFGTGKPPATPSKEQGYPSRDRAKLEKIISEGAHSE